MTGWHKVVAVVTVVCLMVGLSPGATDSAAEELTRLMPDDVMLFITTSGADALGPDFRQTILGKLCTDPGVETFYTSIKTELIRKLKEEEGQDVSTITNMVLKYAELVTSRPIIAGVAGVDIEFDDGPPVCVFAILDAGSRKAEFNSAITMLEELIRKEERIVETQIASMTMHTLESMSDIPLYWGWVGDYLVLALNDPQGQVVQHVQKPRALATDHLKKLADHGDILAGYCNVAKIWNRINEIAVAEGGAEKIEPAKAVLDRLGVTKVGAVVGRLGLSGPDLVSESFVEISGPRTGLLAALKPMDSSALAVVDPNAFFAMAVNPDLAGIFGTVMDTIKLASSEDEYSKATQSLAGAESEIGFKIRDDLLESLGGPVVFYTLPAGIMVEAPMGGVVATVRLRDSVRFEKVMMQLEALIREEAGDELQISFQTDAQGRTIHYWSASQMAMLQVLPTWCIVNDQFIVGQNPGVFARGIERVDSRSVAGSVLGTDKFKKTAASMPENLLSVMYVDSEVQFNQAIMQLQQFWPIFAMGATQAEVKLPAVLPQLGHIAKQMQPSIEYVYTADDGEYSHYQGPGIQMSLRDIAGTSFAMGVLMPALARVRQLAFRMTSGTNLSGLGKACLIYAHEHNDRYPPNLQVLVDEYDVTPKSLVSKRKADNYESPSYIYVPGQTATGYPDNVLAYEDPGYCIDGANVLFVDAHVEFMEPEAFRKAIERTYRRLGRDIPEYRFADED